MRILLMIVRSCPRVLAVSRAKFKWAYLYFFVSKKYTDEKKN